MNASLKRLYSAASKTWVGSRVARMMKEKERLESVLCLTQVLADKRRKRISSKRSRAKECPWVPPKQNRMLLCKMMKWPAYMRHMGMILSLPSLLKCH